MSPVLLLVLSLPLISATLPFEEHEGKSKSIDKPPVSMNANIDTLTPPHMGLFLL